MSKWFFQELSPKQQEMAQKLRDFYERCGRRPYQNELGRASKTPKLSELLKEFSSYKDALRTAHLPVLLPNRDDLIDAVLVFYQEHEGEMPTHADAVAGRMLYGPFAFDSQYRAWSKLIDEAKPEVEKLKQHKA